jgi:Sigma-70 region 2
MMGGAGLRPSNASQVPERPIPAGEAAAEIDVSEAGEALYLRLVSDHDRGVRRLASSYEREPARREDLVQDIWLALWQALPRFRGNARSSFASRTTAASATSSAGGVVRRKRSMPKPPLPMPGSIQSAPPPKARGRSTCRPPCGSCRSASVRWSC